MLIYSVTPLFGAFLTVHVCHYNSVVVQKGFVVLHLMQIIRLYAMSPARWLAGNLERLTSLFLELVNVSLREGTVPDTLKETVV